MFFSRQLGQVLKTRNTPQLYFKYDSGYDHSDEIENLLKVVLKKESNDQRINVYRNKASRHGRAISKFLGDHQENLIFRLPVESMPKFLADNEYEVKNTHQGEQN